MKCPDLIIIFVIFGKTAVSPGRYVGVIDLLYLFEGAVVGVLAINLISIGIFYFCLAVF